MKKSKSLQYLLTSACLCSAFIVTCACGGNNTQNGDSVTLDLFETKVLDASALTGEIVWSSSNEEVVTVVGGKVTPLKEGSAEITASDGKKTVKYPVTVEDSGARPAISRIDDVTLYETKTFNLAEQLSTTYKSTAIMEGVTYTYRAVSGNVTVSDDGIITGVKEGIDQINVSATYMGYSIPRKTCNVTVLSANYIEPKQASVSISTVEGDIDPTFVTLEAAKVVVNAVEVKDATVTAKVVQGKEYVELEGMKVVSKAVGTAIVELSATVNGKTVTGDVTVTVHDDKVDYNPNFMIDTGDNDKNKRGKIEKVTEGEEAGSYLYSSPDGNFWQRAIIDSSNVSQIPQKGYKAFTYQVKLATDGTFSTYVPSALASENGTVKYDLSGGKVTDQMDMIVVYDENGENIKGKDVAMQKGKWYTVVYDLTTYEEGWAFLGFTMGGVNAEASESGEQKAYMKDFKWCTTANLLPDGGYDANHAGSFDEPDPTVTTEKDDFINNITFASQGAKIEKVVSGEGDFVGSYKWMSKVGGYAGRITFNDVHDGDGKPQEFFANGNHYIAFEIYLKTGSVVNVCNWPAATDGDESQKVEGVLNATTTPQSFHVFNKLNVRSNLSAGDWYTVVIQVDYEETPAWTLQWLGLPGSKYTPGVAYIRNFRYSKTMPVNEVIPGESERYSVGAGGAILEDLKEGEEDIVKYTGKVGGNYYENRLGFSEVAGLDNAQPVETYFNSNNQYIAFKMRPEKDVQVAFVMGFGYTGVGVDLTAKDAAVRVRDSKGAPMNKSVGMQEVDKEVMYYVTLTAGEWYTVVIHLPHDGMIKAPVQCGVRFRTNTDPVASFKDLTFSAEDPLAGEVLPEPDVSEKYVIPDGGGTVAMGTENGFTDAVKYTSTSGLWAARMTFADVANGSYAKDGNKWISFKMYTADTTDIVAKLGASDPDGTALVAHENILVYNAQKQLVTSLEKGAWYTVVFKWDTTDTFLFIEVSGSTATPLTTYFKDLIFGVDWPLTDIDAPVEPDGSEAYSVGNGATIVKVDGDIGKEPGSFTYTVSTSLQNPDGILCFTEVNAVDGTTGSFWESDNYYVSFWVRATDADTLNYLYISVDGVGAGKVFTDETATFVKVFKKDGVTPVTAFKENTWFTIIVEVLHNNDAEAGKDHFMYIGLADATSEAPKSMYVNNVNFLLNAPDDAATAKYSVEKAVLQNVKTGEFTGSVKYSATTGAGAYGNRIGFAEVATVGNATMVESYFNDGYKYVQFKLYCVNSVNLQFAVGFNAWADYPVFALGANDLVKAFNAEGQEVTALTTGEWYTIVMHVEPEGTTKPHPAWVDVRFSDDTAVAYFKDLQLFTTDPTAVNPEGGNEGGTTEGGTETG